MVSPHLFNGISFTDHPAGGYTVHIWNEEVGVVHEHEGRWFGSGPFEGWVGANDGFETRAEAANALAGLAGWGG
jgi:hypothetical protein